MTRGIFKKNSPNFARQHQLVSLLHLPSPVYHQILRIDTPRAHNKHNTQQDYRRNISRYSIKIGPGRVGENTMLKLL